jgi:hypothetical protein
LTWHLIQKIKLKLICKQNTMTDGQLRFSLAERKPGTIQSPGGGSGKTVALDDESARQTLQTIHKASAEAHGVADW